MGESDVYLFAGISGDLFPNHINEDFMKKRGFGRRIAHGVLILAYSSTTSSMISARFVRASKSIDSGRSVLQT